MSNAILTAVIREEAGKGIARKLRREGRIPAVLYGAGEALMLTLSMDEVEAMVYRGQGVSGLVELELEGEKGARKNVLIKELQTHPFRDIIHHIDFLEIKMDEEIRTKVPLVTVGEAVGTKMGGILEFKRREIEIACLPTAIPESIEIDISDLDIGDSVHVGSLVAPEGVSIPHDINFTILTVVGAAAEEIPEEEAEEMPEAEAAEPELIGRGKEEEPEEGSDE